MNGHQSPLNENLAEETEKLIRSWEQYDATKLREYLVADVEDPRINLQSILTRHFLATLLFAGQFDELKAEELRFGAAMNWLLSMRRKNLHPDDWHALLHALEHGADNAEGLEVPSFMVHAYASLPHAASSVTVPNYIRDSLLMLRQEKSNEASGWPATSGTFEVLWRNRLAVEQAPIFSVCEAACGSANDYRFVESHGLGRFLDYTGFDISEKNIANASAMFPGKRFRAGNVFAIDLPDGAVQACYFHDLLEHLSPEGLEQAVAELCRVTGRSLCAGFFSMFEGPENVIRPMDEYYCNTLSRARTEALFGRHGFTARAVHIDSYARKHLGFFGSHNPNAYTIFFDQA